MTWINSEDLIISAVLFGSTANKLSEVTLADKWSDIDIHIITSSAEKLESINWALALPRETFCHQAIRPATGGVRKISVIFASGQLDLVLIPVTQLYFAKLGMAFGFHRRPGRLQVALNEIYVSIQAGYHFIKGDRSWGAFYSRIFAEMAGVRLTNSEIINLAGVFLCDMLWTLQKIDRGELTAAQRTLHVSLADINFRLVRELLLRDQRKLPSYGLGRHLETLLIPAELPWVQINSQLNKVDLRCATWRLADGLTQLMKLLCPSWFIPEPMAVMLAKHQHALA